MTNSESSTKVRRSAAVLILLGVMSALIVNQLRPGTDFQAGYLAALAVLGIALWRDGRLAAVLLGGLLAYFGLWQIVANPIGSPTLGIVILGAGVGLASIALIRSWPVIRPRRTAQVGIALAVVALVAWGAVRFVVPPLLGWPVVSCGPGTTRADCSAWEGYLYAPELLLPMTEVTIDGYGTCDARARIRFLDGSVGYGSPGGLC